MTEAISPLPPASDLGAPVAFPAIVVHPRLFKAPLTNPLHPARMPVLVQINDDRLCFLAARNQRRVLGCEPLDQLEVSVRSLMPGQRRLEILGRSIAWVVVLAVLTFLYFAFWRGYPPRAAALAGLIVGGLILPLNFMLNGGLTASRPVVRFQFRQLEDAWTFFLEVPDDQRTVVIESLDGCGLWNAADASEIELPDVESRHVRRT